MSLNEKSIKALENLRRHPPVKSSYHATKQSAVLMLLVANSDGDLEVILTVRSTALRTNGGDVSLPGGKCDPQDVDRIATAKREAFEEIGLLPSASEVLTILYDVVSLRLHLVTPCIAFCPGMTTADIHSLTPNPDEVTAIFTAPLEYFIHPQMDEYRWGDMDWEICEFRVHYFTRCGTSNYMITKEFVDKPEDRREGVIDRSQEGWTVYGLTADLLIRTAQIAYDCKADFEVHAPRQIQDSSLIVKWFKDSGKINAKF
ncbi:Peroxisomal coenzyme A diphosphatase nudt7 [Entomortierella beljakovae]|nr:Peroxisomal coenzyme A diphosphatase nudt7 [Entomortierella beljakovae]